MLLPKIYIGPMSKNIVDVVIWFNSDNFGFIPSRRQVDYNGGYVNGWTTERFSKYVNGKVVIGRDHGGPEQGYSCTDDGMVSFSIDAENFDIIHIDPWKRFNRYEDGLNATIEGIELCYSINKNCLYEIGTEEAIRHFSTKELRMLLTDLKRLLTKQVFSKIAYSVVQSGAKIDLGEQSNSASFDYKRMIEMVDTCREFGIFSKEHNGDYFSLDEIKARFKFGVSAINIAPQFGQIETKTYLSVMDKDQVSEFYRICYDSRRWERWIGKNFISDKKKLIMICGHYVLSTPDFLELKKNVEEGIGKSMDSVVKNNIKKYLYYLTLGAL